MSYRILLVDDDSMLREALREQLENNGYQVKEAGNATDAIDDLNHSWYDAILLDVGLPDMDGREACEKIRKANFSAPIIMLTAHDTEKDIINGFDSGASDYIAKPFRLGELLARLQSHLRQHEKREDIAYTIGPYRFQPGKRVLKPLDGDRDILLTEKEANILKMLYRADGDIVKREDLLQAIWGYNDQIVTHTLETHIYRLRNKIENKKYNKHFLMTVPNIGYYLHKKGIEKTENR